MSQPIPRFIAPTVAVLALVAVSFAGFGGMAQGHKLYPLFGAGAAVCLLMALVFEIVLVTLVSRNAMYGLAAGQGALMGACGSLFFLPGSGLMSLVAITAGGAIAGAICLWWYELRYAILFDR